MILNQALIELTKSVKKDTCCRTPQSAREIGMAARQVERAAEALTIERLDVLADRELPEIKPLPPIMSSEELATRLFKMPPPETPTAI